MSGPGNGCDAGALLKKLGLRPVTRCSLAKFYVPAFGAASYTAMSINVMNPSLVVKVFPRKDITNFLLAGTLIGTASFIYTREHLQSASQRQKALYSVTGAILLSLGSVLLWAVIRSIVPPNPACCTIAGIGSGVALLKIGSSYLEFVDGQIAKNWQQYAQRAASIKTDIADKDEPREEIAAIKRGGFLCAITLSPELAAFVGAKQMARHEVIKKIWSFVKERNLYDPKDKQYAICDEELIKVIGVKRFRVFGVMTHLKNHFDSD